MPLEYVILRLLHGAPLHGYALRQFVIGLRFFYPMSNPNLYPVLRKMEDKGWVKHRKSIVDNRLRKVYELTSDGDAALTAWLSERPGEPMEISDPLVLKVALLTEAAAPRALEWLEAEVDEMRAQIEAGEERVREFAGSMSQFTRSSSEFALEIGRVRLRWVEGLVERLRQAEPLAPSRRR
jgi:DNA-binding PadR family transcriptional regulator